MTDKTQTPRTDGKRKYYATRSKTFIEYFQKRITKTKSCWIWNGSVAKNGYGKANNNGRSMLAHRAIYIYAYGEIPDGYEIDHLCRNRRCVNPKHLEAVTKKENILRGISWAAINAKKTHCINGHKFDNKNTVIRKMGWRSCRQCNRERYVRQDGRPNVARAR